MLELVQNNLLSVVIFLPLVGAAALIALSPWLRSAAEPADGHGGDAPARPDARAGATRWITLVFTAATFLASVGLYLQFDPSRPGYQFEMSAPWIDALHVNFHIGLDGISLLLVMLSTFLSLLAVIYSFHVGKRVLEYNVFLLVLQTAMTGVFCALDLVLFYVFWEAVLIPMYFLIGIWGHERRIYAAIKFFLYTFAGSILMLVAIAFVYWTTQTFDIVALTTMGTQASGALNALGGRTMLILYAAFALAFMIKVPMFPFHTWLPDAHVEAPTAGSVLLAGILLKMGTYGFLRICLPMFPVQAAETAWLFIALAIVGIIYGAIVAAVQPDMKKLVAYSSVSHLGFVMLGIYSFTPIGITGAVLQNLNHGVSTGMLFFLVGMLYDRRHTREIAAFGGIKRVLPVLSAFFLIAMLSSIALPLTNGFVGEFTILQGAYRSSIAGPPAAALAGLGMVLSAVYMLWLFQRVFTGPADKAENQTLRDLCWREKLVLAPLVVMVFWFGCYVTTWTRIVEPPSAGISNQGSTPSEMLMLQRQTSGPHSGPRGVPRPR